MTILLFANNAQTTLASSISASATTCTLATGTGSKFPSPAAGQGFKMTFTDAATGNYNEIVLCTARSFDICTIVRAQEGTTARAWIASDIASNYFTAGAAAAFAQISTNTPTVTTVTNAFYTQTTSDTTLIVNTAFTVTLTLLAPASYYGNFLWIKNPNGVIISSASSNVVPSGSLSAGTAILSAVAGTFCLLQSDGTNWNVISTSLQPSGF